MTRTQLLRAVGLPGATLMGLGSIVGTGVFVSLGLAAGLAGSTMVLALFLAGCLATFNGLSTAQLAADHPVSGGSYEYGYKHIHPWVGYLAGWLFVVAKSASAATAAIGFAAYFLQVFEISSISPWLLALIVVLGATGISLLGVKRSSAANTVIVLITLLSLFLYVVTLFPQTQIQSFSLSTQKFYWPNFLEATALMFVAYTGYGRVATLGEEIKDPVRNIPKAIIVTLLISFCLYLSVACVSLGTVGADQFYRFTLEQNAPLHGIAVYLGHPQIAMALSLGAMTALLGVLLNLVLGVSRVVFAMGKREDLPACFSKVSQRHHAPSVAILFTGAIIGILTFIGDIKATWSFSAFTVLVYYAITNIAALRLPIEKRLYPRFFAWLGLFSCLTLSFWVEQRSLLLGLTVISLGVLWRWMFKASKRLFF